MSPRYWPFLKAEPAHICMQMKNKTVFFVYPEALNLSVCKSALACVKMALRSMWCAMPARCETWHGALETAWANCDGGELLLE